MCPLKQNKNFRTWYSPFKLTEKEKPISLLPPHSKSMIFLHYIGLTLSVFAACIGCLGSQEYISLITQNKQTEPFHKHTFTEPFHKHTFTELFHKHTFTELFHKYTFTELFTNTLLENYFTNTLLQNPFIHKHTFTELFHKHTFTEHFHKHTFTEPFHSQTHFFSEFPLYNIFFNFQFNYASSN